MANADLGEYLTRGRGSQDTTQTRARASPSALACSLPPDGATSPVDASKLLSLIHISEPTRLALI
eukprot:1066658-Alexandrium_andersonii.AAC.1